MDREKARDRIRKLLALGQSPNRHEASSALEQAAALMFQFDLDETDVEGEAPTPGALEEFVLQAGGIEREYWRGQLAHAAATLLGGGFYFRGSDLVVVATGDRLGLIRAAYDYLVDAVENEASAAARRRNAIGDFYWRQEFLTAAACEIGLRAEKAIRERKSALRSYADDVVMSGACRAIMRRGDEVEAYLDRVSVVLPAVAIGDPTAMADGRAAGGRVNFDASGLASAAPKLKG